MTLLRRPFFPSAAQLLRPNLLGLSPAHAKLRRQLRQASRSRFVGFQKLAPQIIRIGLWHPFVGAEIANSKLPLPDPLGI